MPHRYRALSIVGIYFCAVAFNGKDVYFLTVDIGFFVLDDDDKVVPAQFAAHAFCDERIVDFAAVGFDGMEFLFVGGTEFPVFNGVMVHPALFGYVPQVGDGFAD